MILETLFLFGLGGFLFSQIAMIMLRKGPVKPVKETKPKFKYISNEEDKQQKEDREDSEFIEENDTDKEKENLEFVPL